ncbi:hypothetical protein GTP46_24465 [Duganella sp. FT135W]|uniref:Uncharacterized protein n=1 Tax=Duganella flavida TaxID=2692175 RepID=A0A6L8KEG2_9BURK|nr:hypothetical protein [Duganella flavida]MYM25786.1 hypothetical protein [Duganella flavida]
MAIQPPPAISPAPLPAAVRGEKATFSDRIDQLVTWWQTSPAQIAALASNMWANAQETYNNAMTAARAAADASSAATAAAASASAVKWVSGATYADGDVAWSPMDRLSYRRIGAGSGATDPKLDAVHWAIQLYALGLGGQVLSTSVSLVSTSPSAITVTPTGAGFYALLPDATTCQKGLSLFAVYNNGEIDYGVKDFAGTQLGWVRPGATALIGLSDNSNAAGSWIVSGAQKIGVTGASPVITAITSGSSTRIQRVAIDSTRSFLMIGGNGSSSNLYGVIHDSSLASPWGTPVLIAGTRLFANAILSAANQILVSSCSSSEIDCVTITISGTGLTVNSGSLGFQTLAGAPTSWGQLIAVGSSWVQGYVYSGQTAMRAITISGNAPTVGAQTSIVASSGPVPAMYVSGSTLRVVHFDGTYPAVKPYTLSGTTFTAGNGAIIANTPPYQDIRSFQNGNGNLVVMATGSGLYMVGVFKLTGTIEASSYTTFSMSGSGTPKVDVVPVSGSKAALFVADATGGAIRVDIITDSAGTLSLAGFPLTYAMGGCSALAALAISGTTVRIGFTSSSITYQMSVDCVGSSPTLISAQAVRTSIALPGPSALNGGQRDYTLLRAGNTTYSSLSAAAVTGSDGAFLPSSVRAIAQHPQAIVSGTPGAAANESWGIEAIGVVGAVIKRLEVCA